MTSNAAPGPHQDKVCPTCGRRFAWRKKWADTWAEVRFCSAGCRRAHRPRRLAAVDEALLAWLTARGPAKSVCPSEVARQLGDELTWRDWMEPVRAAARRLAHQGRAEITQRGQAVGPDDFRGPIRVRLVAGGGQDDPPRVR